jgi:hypothetical protein
MSTTHRTALRRPSESPNFLKTHTMNIFSKLALAATLALVGLTGAQAASVQETGDAFVLMDSGDPGQKDNTWTLDPSVFGEAMKSGDTFYDVFTFNVPDEEVISFGFTSTNSHPGGFGVKFIDFGLFIYTDGTPIDIQNALPFSISAGLYDLTSGTYSIVVEGTYRKDGGTYSGFIDGVPAVPEPAGWTLLLAGLGVMGSIARRRSNNKG